MKNHFDDEHGVHKALNDKKVISRVKNIQAQTNGNDVFRTIALGSASKIEDADNWFLQFNHTMPDPKPHAMERTISFGNPALFESLNGKIDLHIDTSFCVVPKPFYQMLVVMAHDPQTGACAPCAHVLTTGE